MPNGFEQIEGLTKTYADAHGALADVLSEAEAEVVAARRRHMRRIKNAAEKKAQAHEALSAAIAAAPALFEKPRSRLFHGVRVGLQKGKGELKFDDAAQVVKLIRKHFPEQFDVLVKIEERPLKTPLAQLAAADLKKLGITVENTGPQVLIKVADTDLDKLLAAMLDGAEEVEEAAA